MTMGRDGENSLRLEGLRTTDAGPFVCQVNTVLFFIPMIKKIMMINKIMTENNLGWDSRRRCSGGGASSCRAGFQHSRKAIFILMMIMIMMIMLIIMIIIIKAPDLSGTFFFLGLRGLLRIPPVFRPGLSAQKIKFSSKALKIL